jgi:phosphoglycolate phosphatase
LATIQCGQIQFPAIQAVIFDKDGTLAETQDFLRNLGQKRSRLIDAQIPGVQEPLLMAFGLNGNYLNPSGLLAVGTRRENEIAAAAYVAETGRDWIESLAIVRSAFLEADHLFKRKADHTPLVDGARDILQRLTNAGMKIGILSSDTTANVQDFVARYQLAAFVQLQMGVENGSTKPDPTVLWHACEKLAVTPETVLLIGDSFADSEMARSAGVAGYVGVSWGETKPFPLEQAAVHMTRFSDIQIVA